MLVLFPEGFEETEREALLELVAYTDAEGEQRLRAAFGHTASTPVAPDWDDRWRAFHRPVRIGPLWVGPPWERAPGSAIAVVVDPGRAFGTGAHPTTRLCLALLLELERGSLLDLGCGSGVLAIAAAKLGFAPVHALDTDREAVEATRENAARNHVSVEAYEGDARSAELPATDVAVANIALDAVEAVVPRLRARRVVTSGYLETDRPALPGLRHLGRRSEREWAADLYEPE
jgi:ribosomal protein L11 methyltransferase